MLLITSVMKNRVEVLLKNIWLSRPWRNSFVLKSFTPRLFSSNNSSLLATDSEANHVKEGADILNELKILQLDTISEHVLRSQYAVRGEIAILADKLKTDLHENGQSHPFSNVIQCNLGNPQHQSLGQKPITFYRQVLSLMEMSHLWIQNGVINSSLLEQFVPKSFPKDVVERVRQLSTLVGPVGAYSHSKGALGIRQHVAQFIERRDGYPSDPESIFLTSGASMAIQTVLRMIIKNEHTGILIPSPQYPLYSASITLMNGRTVYYDLEEENDWSVSEEAIIKSLSEARSKGIEVRALCIINPGNPTGNVFTFNQLQSIIRICRDYRLILLSDEVYQDNIYDPIHRPFYSAKRVLKEMGPGFENVELFSFHSVSKGLVGECGRRGGYVECCGIDKSVLDQLYKLASITLCSNLQGQMMVDLVVNPPSPGDLSHALFVDEKQAIMDSLRRRAFQLVSTLRELEGVKCNAPEGALYVFPSYEFPPSLIEEAERLNREADTYYALQLLQETGICAVNGSGFGQKPGSYHLRFTFLPPEEEFPDFLTLLKNFHLNFMQKYPIIRYTSYQQQSL